MKIFVCLLALACSASSIFVPLSTYGEEATSYKLKLTDKLFVISNSDQETLQALTITSSASGKSSNGFILSTVQTDGSLTPFQSSSDNEYVDIVFSGATKPSGYLYINKITDTLSLFPLTENSVVSVKEGVNVFIQQASPDGKIPVAENVDIGNNAVLTGFTNLPDETSKVLFFDSSSIERISTYNQLELPMQIFHLVVTGNNVKCQVKYSQRLGMTAVGSSGLLMNDGFPSGIPPMEDYTIANPNNLNINMTLVPRLDSTKLYGGNVTVFYSDVSASPLNFPISSDANSLMINSQGQLSRVVVDAEGAYSIQYYLEDATVTTTPAPVETTTKSASLPQVVASLLVAALLLF